MTPTPAPGMPSGVTCAATIGQLNARELAENHAPKSSSNVFVTRDGPWALISWHVGDEGGHAMYHHVDGEWCQVMNSGGGIGESMLTDVAGPGYGHRLWVMWNKGE